MPVQRTFLVRASIKVVVGIVVGGVLIIAARSLEFPPVFQVMFFIYAMLGAAVFILLDAPALPAIGGLRAAVTLLIFYVGLSGLYIGGAALLPQYDPQDEKGKIDKLLKAKRERALQEANQVEALLAQAKTLEDRVEALTARLNTVAPAPKATEPVVDLGRPSRPGDIIARGAEVYDLHECYNCHKIGGKGSVKKRGPILDNIGSFLTVEDVKRKIFDPTYLYAEGFEKEHKKGVMPDKYRDLMTDEEVTALAMYLGTLKDPSSDTPKPVFVKTKVEHGFIVYGYVRDASGKGLADVPVQATPLKKDGHAASGKTNEAGYYEIFLHMHNEDVGVKIQVTAKGIQKEVVANYDPNDKVTKRQAAVDLTVS